MLRALVEDTIRLAIHEFKDVGGAAGIQSVLANAVTPPGCYVFRQKVTVNPNTAISTISQLSMETLGVLVVTRNVQDARGGVNSDESEALCTLIRGVLLGLTVDNSYAPLEYGGGDLVLMRDGLHFWRELWQTSRYLRVA